MSTTRPLNRFVRRLLFTLLLATILGAQAIRGRASLTMVPAIQATAVFGGSDSTRQGNWIGTYGKEGYGLLNDALHYPAYAQVAVHGALAQTWADSTTDVRALQRPTAANRLTACLFASHSFTIDVNLTDGMAHQVALYLLDWDGAGARTERIDVLDAVSGAVLDTRTVTGFQGGQYLVWSLSGHVALRVANTSAINAVVSGLFFDAAPPVTVTTVRLTALSPRPTYRSGATVQLDATASARAGTTISRVEFLNGTTVIGSAVASPYTLSWSNVVRGTYSLSARAIDNTGATVTSSPVTVAVAAASGSVVFQGSDTATHGDWRGTYGGQGYGLINNAVNYPGYAQVALSGAVTTTWASSTADVRALQRPAAAGRIAACWYSNYSFTIDVNLTDGVAHEVALYALDWDTTARIEQIDVLDAGSGEVLDTRTLSQFQGGQYLVWTLSGHVTLRVTNTNPAVNAVVSGLFFDATPSVTRVTLGTTSSGAAFAAPAMISLTAMARASSGKSISRVDFLNGPTVIGSVVPGPNTLSGTLLWTGALPGTYSLSARATDNTGTTVTSSPITVTMTAKTIPRGVPASAASGLIVQKTDLVYQGAFRLPHDPIGVNGGSSFDYGGTALAFNPARGSLFMVGHDYQQQVAEVTVPAIRRGASLSDLAVAGVLQPFADVTEGLIRLVGVTPTDNVKVGGLLPYQGQLYITAYRYYDANANQEWSHIISGLDFSVQGDARGPYRTSARVGLTAGYFGLVPAAWQDALGGPVLNGQCCLAIISRTSFGPGVFTIDPTRIGPNAAPATPLVYYDQGHQTLGTYGLGGQSTVYNGATQMGGVVFPEGTRSVLFFGMMGLGPYCYGTGEECHDPAGTGKGEHAYPYVSYVWAYDAIDLAAVKNGEKQPWDVKPYAVWTLDLPFSFAYPQILGATYDPATGRIFLTQAHGDGDLPLVHVFTIGS